MGRWSTRRASRCFRCSFGARANYERRMSPQAGALMLDIETLHHVSLPVSDLARAKHFYAEVLGLREIARPPFDFPGAWFAVGDRQLHLIVHDGSTFRVGKLVDTRDAHFAIRVSSYRAAREHLHAL